MDPPIFGDNKAPDKDKNVYLLFKLVSKKKKR
jgi:hypothetical protein